MHDITTQSAPVSEILPEQAADTSPPRWSTSARTTVVEQHHGEGKTYVSMRFGTVAVPPGLRESLAALAVLPVAARLRELLPLSEPVAALVGIRKTLSEHPELQHVLASHGQALRIQAEAACLSLFRASCAAVGQSLAAKQTQLIDAIVQRVSAELTALVEVTAALKSLGDHGRNPPPAGPLVEAALATALGEPLKATATLKDVRETSPVEVPRDALGENRPTVAEPQRAEREPVLLRP